MVGLLSIIYFIMPLTYYNIKVKSLCVWGSQNSSSDIIRPPIFNTSKVKHIIRSKGYLKKIKKKKKKNAISRIKKFEI